MEGTPGLTGDIAGLLYREWREITSVISEEEAFVGTG